MRLRATTIDAEYVRLSGHYSDSVCVNWAGYLWGLGAGHSDWLYGYRDLDSPEALWILAVNRRYGYISLMLLDSSYEPVTRPDSPTEPRVVEVTWDIFAQDPDDEVSGFKSDGVSLMDMAPHNAIRYLAQWYWY